MDVLQARIEWMMGYGNPPNLQILVDGRPRPDELRYKAYPTKHNCLYVAEKDGFVDFLLHSPNNERGYGGRSWTLTLEDGSEVTVKGPWSSNAGYVRAIAGLEAREVSITDDMASFYRGYTFIAGAITRKLYVQTMKTFFPEHELEYDDYGQLQIVKTDEERLFKAFPELLEDNNAADSTGRGNPPYFHLTNYRFFEVSQNGVSKIVRGLDGVTPQVVGRE